jgi:hypothetical protein
MRQKRRGLPLTYGTVAFFSAFGISSTRVVCHEIGHSFTLKHDFTNYGNTIASEHVIRDYNGDGYNANGYGDQIHSTPATRIWDENQYNSLGIYIGTDIDHNDELLIDDNDRKFKTELVRKNNLMHVHDGPDYSMGYFLSSGQGSRLRWAIGNDILNQYDAWYLAQVEEIELYKPFDSRYMGGDHIISVSNNSDGTARVCRTEIHRDRYQKGLNYVFVHGDADELFDSSTPDQLKNIDQTANYKVRLPEIDPEQKIGIEINCTRGVFCNNEIYTSGIIYSTQVLGSMNITVAELNEIQVSNPELYETLISQYYYILKKYTESGAIKQEVFYKP